MRNISQSILFLCLVLVTSCYTNNKRKPKPNDQSDKYVQLSKEKNNIDSSKNNESAMKKYNEIITSKCLTDEGVFSVHRFEKKIYFEISDSILDRDLLIVSRISKASAGNRPGNNLFGYAGDQINASTVRFSKGPDNKIFIRDISYSDRSKDSTEDGLYSSIINSNLQPILAAFEIKTMRSDSSSLVIDVTDFINSDNNILFFNGNVKKSFNLGGYLSDKSYVGVINSFPINLELQTVKTYSFGEATVTYELNTSVVLLPKNAMDPRFADERVGYFSTAYNDFDATTGVKLSKMINRWRLEPKKSEVKKYLQGILVEPEKKIVFYIDPATPKKWVPYLIQGVNDWQKAFEKAGFKNAIIGLPAPIMDPEWNLYDGRHNAIIYKPSVIPNASGPSISDPRSGEILETHVNWYHNVIQLLRNWYLVQAAAIDPRARTFNFDDSLMGQLIRFVSCHEVGHTLGLMHNFGSSATISVDSLRSKRWVEENGHTPSIMDYARFNYVAQPEDSVSQIGIFPRIGIYDEWAIEWGYRWFPQFKSKEEEFSFMSDWITRKLSSDKRFIYGEQVMSVTDPRNQSEDLGDDAMKASYYGILNLKRILPMLMSWTVRPNENFENLNLIYQQVITQYKTYINHVTNNIGLYTWTRRSSSEKGDVVGFLPKEKQRRAVEFLNAQLFETPKWLLSDSIFKKVGGYGPNLPIVIQVPILNKLMSNATYDVMFYSQASLGSNAYTFQEMLNDLERGIWSELTRKQPIDPFRRRLQKAYAERLIEMVDPMNSEIQSDRMSRYYNLRSDYYSIVKEQIKSLSRMITGSINGYNDQGSGIHLASINDRLKRVLINLKYLSPILPAANNKTAFADQLDFFNIAPIENIRVKEFQDKNTCWECRLFFE